MLGSATFTIVMSSSSISMPRHTVSRVHHLRAINAPPANLRNQPRPSRSSVALAPAISPVSEATGVNRIARDGQAPALLLFGDFAGASVGARPYGRRRHERRHQRRTEMTAAFPARRIRLAQQAPRPFGANGPARSRDRARDADATL